MPPSTMAAAATAMPRAFGARVWTAVTRQPSTLEGAGRHHLFHQVVVPLALHHEVGCCTQQSGLDEVVVHIGIDARLAEGVERGTRAAATDEPGLHVGEGRVAKLAGFT